MGFKMKSLKIAPFQSRMNSPKKLKTSEEVEVLLGVVLLLSSSICLLLLLLHLKSRLLLLRQDSILPITNRPLVRQLRITPRALKKEHYG